MALRAGDLIEQARFAHPAFDRSLAPTSVCAQMLDEGQARLTQLAHQRAPSYGILHWVVRFLPGQTIAQAGAGSAYGSPLAIDAGGELIRRPVDTGSLATPAESTVYVAERAATGGSLTTLTDSTQAWVANAFVSGRVTLMSGTGAGQRRTIAANVATTLVVTDPFLIAPDPTTTYRIDADVEQVGGEFGVILGQMPPSAPRSGYLVLLDAQGQPYLDLASPIVADVALGVPIPPSYFVDHGVVRFIDTPSVPDHVRPLTITTYGQRNNPPREYSAAVAGGQLELLGPMGQWRGVTSLTIPYLPIAPAVDGAGALLLMRDDAKYALIAQVVLGLCRRARAMGVTGPPGSIESVEARANETERNFLDTVAGAGRAKMLTTKEVW